MRPINRIPQGFLDFFGLKSLGRNPEVLLDEVRPSLDMTEWYLRTNAEQMRGFTTHTAPFIAFGDPFDGPIFTVPPGEWWFVHAATLVVFGQVGAVWRQPGIMTVRNSQPSQYFEALVSTNMTDAADGTSPVNSHATFSARPRVWLPPNTQIGTCFAYIDDGTMAPGDTLNFNVHLSVTRASS